MMTRILILLQFFVELLAVIFKQALWEWFLPSSAQAPANLSWAEVSLNISQDGRPAEASRPEKVSSEQAKGPSKPKFCI